MTERPPKKTKAPPYDGPSAAQLFEDRRRRILPSAMTYHSEPFVAARAEMQYVYDEKGDKHLDAFGGAGAVSVGHCHPDVVRAVQRQAEVLDHCSTYYLYPGLTRCAQRLVQAVQPANPDLEVCCFTTSGSEAVELAVEIAKAATGHADFIALEHSCHGHTPMAQGLTGEYFWRSSPPYPYGAHHAPADYGYRRPEGMTSGQFTSWCAEGVERVVRGSTSGTIAAFIAEPVMAMGGVIVPEPPYFPKAYEYVKKYGGLFIVDEAHTGLGRLGHDFLGIQKWGVRPDVVVLAKGLANGFPLGAVVCTRRAAEAMRGRMHFDTFAGSPVALAAAEATLDVLESEGLARAAAEVGAYLKGRLQRLADRSDPVGEVRGMGLLLGVEIVRSKSTKIPAPEALGKVMDLMKGKGVLTGRGGMAGNVLRLEPPLCVGKSDADWIVEALEAALLDIA